ncbi:hypothetical protein WN51_11262 [Melipona quadrifasciata]|uniref:Uncharacterized protein n=1 Tax=Melipona quadrifasciata TaxID=166423 RepID=A0A0N1ITS4_9HYME|nr:hypothetical protein WN51_11262 [Melipona quadrifasciata]
MKPRIREARWQRGGGLAANVRVSLWSNPRPQRRTQFERTSIKGFQIITACAAPKSSGLTSRRKERATSTRRDDDKSEYLDDVPPIYVSIRSRKVETSSERSNAKYSSRASRGKFWRDSRRQWKDHPLMYLHGVETASGGGRLWGRDTFALHESPGVHGRKSRLSSGKSYAHAGHQGNENGSYYVTEQREALDVIENSIPFNTRFIRPLSDGRGQGRLPLLKLSASEKKVTSKLRYIRGVRELHPRGVQRFTSKELPVHFHDMCDICACIQMYTLSLITAITSVKIFDFVACSRPREKRVNRESS